MVFAATFSGPVLGPDQVAQALPGKDVSGSCLTVGGVGITPVPTRHIGKASQTTSHFSFVIEGSHRVWFMGDATPAQMAQLAPYGKPDVLIVRYWMSYFAPSLGFITRRMKRHCKVISIIDNVIPHEPRFFDTPLTRYFLTGSTGSVTLCEAVARDLLRIKPGAEHKVIPHPLYSHFGAKRTRDEAERRLGLMPGMKNILFFGLIREYKGLDILLKAFEDLPEDYQLIIAGEPYGSFDRYARIMDSFPESVRRRIFMELKYIKDSEVSDYFSASDLAVLPYRSATQSGISSVAYHFEIPMIVTDVGGLKETIGDRGTGIVAENAAPESIRKEILRYFNEDNRERFIENIRKEKERLSWKSFAAELVEFIDRL